MPTPPIPSIVAVSPIRRFDSFVACTAVMPAQESTEAVATSTPVGIGTAFSSGTTT